MIFFEIISWEPAPQGYELPFPEVHLFKVKLEAAPDFLESQKKILSEEENRRMERFHFEKDRRRFALSRIHLRTLLGKYLHHNPQDILFTNNEQGKPSLLSPAPSIYFNLSHSHEWCLMAFTRTAELGVDLEYEKKNPKGLDVASKYFSEKESALLRSAPEEKQGEYFLTLWTLKEAFIKAKGQGLKIPLDSFEIVWQATHPRPILRLFQNPSEAATWGLFSFIPETGYRAAVAIQNPQAKLKIFSHGTVQPMRK